MQAVPTGFARARAICCRCVALLCVVLAPAAGQSQTFPPPNAWTALERNGQTIVDPAFDLAVIQSARDIVGCAPSPSIAGLTCAIPSDLRPAAFITSDADALYFRLRVDGNPAPLAFGYGCQINTNGNTNNADHCYEYMVVANKAASVDLYQNPAAGCTNSPSDSANTLLDSYTPSANYTAVASDGNVDFFVDFAVPWTGFPALRGSPLQFVCGTNANGGNVFTTGGSADIANNNDATTIPTWSGIDSDLYACGDIGCAVCPFAPVFTSAGGAIFETDTASSFQVLVFACPSPAVLSVDGVLPDGITFDSATSILGGTTGPDFVGDYPLTFHAGNGIGDETLQPFILHIVLRDQIFADGFDMP